MRKKGFTLIELLIVVAIIGIIVAIAIPNLLSAVQRSRQKRTMADMRAIANVWETYYTDYSYYYNTGNCTHASGTTASTDDQVTQSLDYSVLTTILVPTYIGKLPRNDGWNAPFYFFVDVTTRAQAYRIASGGKNGTLEGDYCGITKYFDNDIVFSVGQFVEWPEGAQKTSTSGT